MKVIRPLIIILTIAAMVNLFNGCNNDKEDPAPTQAELLIGTWQFTNGVVSECTDPLDNYTETCTTECETIVVTSSTVTMLGDSYPYTINGNNLSINMGSGLTLTVNFVVSGSTLTITLKDSAEDGNCKYVSNYKKI
jgi:hypothetical protein